MPQFALMIYADDTWEVGTPEHEAEVMERYGAFGERHESAIRGGAELDLEAPQRRVAIRGGERILHDGPFAEVREILGGFYLVEAPDLDAAVAIAAEIPDADRGFVHVVQTTEHVVEDAS